MARAFNCGRVLMRYTLVMAALLGACQKGEETRRSLDGSGSPGVAASAKTLPPGLTPLAAAQLDSGNVAFRAQRYDEALAYYRAATIAVPQHASPWYGIYMVAQATGNQGLADSASRAVRRRDTGGELQDTGVAKAHGAETGTGHPPGGTSN